MTDGQTDRCSYLTLKRMMAHLAQWIVGLCVTKREQPRNWPPDRRNLACHTLMAVFDRGQISEHLQRVEGVVLWISHASSTLKISFIFRMRFLACLRIKMQIIGNFLLMAATICRSIFWFPGGQVYSREKRIEKFKTDFSTQRKEEGN